VKILTGDRGAFTCEKGDTLTFSIGTVELGKTYCKEIVTPVDLAMGLINSNSNFNALEKYAALNSSLKTGAQRTAQLLLTIDGSPFDDKEITIGEDAEVLVDKSFKEIFGTTSSIAKLDNDGFVNFVEKIKENASKSSYSVTDISKDEASDHLWENLKTVSDDNFQAVHGVSKLFDNCKVDNNKFTCDYAQKDFTNIRKKILVEKLITVNDGGKIEVSNVNSSLNGISLTIEDNILSNDTLIQINEVLNSPSMPPKYRPFKTTIEISPSNINFDNLYNDGYALLSIPNIKVPQKSNQLKLFSYEQDSDGSYRWAPIKIDETVEHAVEQTLTIRAKILKTGLYLVISIPKDDDGLIYSWSIIEGYSVCSKSCGGGVQARTVLCRDNFSSVVSDQYCNDEKPLDKLSCNEQPCDTYYWYEGDWGSCGKSCGGGVKSRVVQCRSNTGMVVNSINCKEKIPESEVECNIESCKQYSWKEGPYGSCSESCGDGIQKREITCVNNYGEVGLEKLCTGAKPGDSRKCNEQDCLTYNWSVSDYNACDKICNGGTKTRTSNCKDSTGKIVDESKCTDKKPELTQTCNNDPCIDYSWFTGDWGSCDQSCSGKQSRVVSCRDNRSVNVSDSKCSEKKPEDSQSCNTNTCKLYTWYTGSYESCSEACNGGVQNRLVQCRDNLGNAVTGSFCTEPQPEAQTKCNTNSCQTYNWVSGAFGACSQSCGGGTQSRSVNCSDNFGKIVSDNNCNLQKPSTSQSCNTEACISYAWKTSDYGACSKTCDSGEKIRNVQCIDSTNKAVTDDKCTGQKPVTTESCNNDPCDQYYWAIGVTGDCSAICGGGTQLRSVECKNQNTQTIVNDNQCTNTKPKAIIACNTHDCNLTTVLAAQKTITPSSDEVIEVTNTNSTIEGAKIEIPKNILKASEKITIREIINSPVIPQGLTQKGPMVDFGPSGLDFQKVDPNGFAKALIPTDLTSLPGPGELKALLSSTNTKGQYQWEPADVLDTKIINGKIFAEVKVKHFSIVTTYTGNVTYIQKPIVYILAGQSNMFGAELLSNLPQAHQNLKIMPANVEYSVADSSLPDDPNLIFQTTINDQINYGPEIYLIHKLSQLHPNRKVIIAKYAIGGSSIYCIRSMSLHNFFSFI